MITQLSVHLLASYNTNSIVDNCLGLSKHSPIKNTSDRQTIGRKQHKGLSTLKLSCPHSCRFSFCFPAVQSPPIRFLGDFRHFQGFPCLSPPFWLLRLLWGITNIPYKSNSKVISLQKYRSYKEKAKRNLVKILFQRIT